MECQEEERREAGIRSTYGELWCGSRIRQDANLWRATLVANRWTVLVEIAWILWKIEWIRWKMEWILWENHTEFTQFSAPWLSEVIDVCGFGWFESRLLSCLSSTWRSLTSRPNSLFVYDFIHICKRWNGYRSQTGINNRSSHSTKNSKSQLRHSFYIFASL